MELKIVENLPIDDITSYHEIFSRYQNQLRSYIYRITANKNDTDDLIHDTFLKSFNNIAQFKGNSSIKTWIFTIGTNLSFDYMKKKKRWHESSLQRAKQQAHEIVEYRDIIIDAKANSTHNEYVIKEHIDYCFTCTTKMLSLEQQLAFLLKDIYEFRLDEIAVILNVGVGKVKHLVRNARQTMIRIFEKTCALVNKKGVCHQCSELNGLFNPKQNAQEELIKTKMVKLNGHKSPEELFEIRISLIKKIDPLNSKGTDLHEAFFKVVKEVNR